MCVCRLFRECVCVCVCVCVSVQAVWALCVSVSVCVCVCVCSGIVGSVCMWLERGKRVEAVCYALMVTTLLGSVITRIPLQPRLSTIREFSTFRLKFTL